MTRTSFFASLMVASTLAAPVAAEGFQLTSP
eukprot:CAMPEP_0184414462 /NCGR_PEP_ID=MMETSP0738-20130409/8038_1 /TAXON_ID=385413 /ORGANISM="Thalassiosira miniscula, Strain CCMP1093" /LENGTH=30 /DNA_ID= /DNA_START= /DNA_END= /DNA_ORIENTATION=